MKRKKIKLGIIGKNFGYNVIYKAFVKNKNFKIIAFSFKSKKYDKNKFSKKIKIYFNWKNLILDNKVNSIAIATPPESHKKIIEFAIKHNKHIFCEKPFTSTYEESNHICNLLDKKKISHMANYEFAEISAFRFFKKNILNKNTKINKIKLNWCMKINRPNISWKDNHSKGGGIMFNYVCHAIYYLEFIFGKFRFKKPTIFFDNKNNINTLKSHILFNSGLSGNLKIGIFNKNSKIKSEHKIEAFSKNDAYVLRSKVDKLSDQFEVLKITKVDNKVSKKISYLFKKKNNISDFRIHPTFINSKKFSTWILEGNQQSPNFFDAKRIHLIIKQLINSSKKKKI